MNKKLINLKLLTDEFDEKLNLEGFDNRLLLQKRVYLIQRLGVNFGFNFHWYLKGPYCPELTECAFTLKADTETQEAANSFVFNDDATAILDRYKGLEREVSSLYGRRLPDWLELMASIHFMRKYAYVPGFPRISRDNIGQALCRKGKVFPQKMVEKAWDLVDSRLFKE